MTSLFSLSFLALFLPVVVALYSATPKRFRWTILLFASYVFFWSVSGALIAFLLVSTVSVYLIGLGVGALVKARNTACLPLVGDERAWENRRWTRRIRFLLAFGLVLNFGLLAACKYLAFIGVIASTLLHLLGIDVEIVPPAIAAPIGISFYTLIAVSYLVDVARGTTEADRNLGRVALFLSFFPQIVEGPICRYKETAGQLTRGMPVTGANLFAGSMRILWGLAKKIIIADRLNAFVKPVFEAPASYDGGIIALGAILYTVQLYCDFSGAMDVSLGTARIFDVKLPENFRQPFFSRTASEFWQRWHITLGTWFRDYVYYPISLSGPSKRLTALSRKRLGSRYGPLLASSIALLAVWLGNGLWHGAGSQYVFFGLYYFALILAGRLVDPLAQKAAAPLGIDRECVGYRAMQIARTLVIVVIGELFFRANGLQTGISMFCQIATGFTLASFADGRVLTIGMDAADFAAVGFGVVAMLLVGIAREKGISVIDRVSAMPAACKWGTWLFLALSIIVFGAYGVGYTPVDPIYAQF